MPAPDLPHAPTFDVPTERPLFVHLHMGHVRPEALRGGVVVVIDAIRASVTIAQALVNGAREILPCLTSEEARERARALRASGEDGGVLLGGERGGVLIEGFDLDNSPFSYSRERVAGKRICFTTSNGTAGLLHAREGARVLVGSMVNARRVCDAVEKDARAVHILCCGTRNDVSLDDCLAAGLIVERLADAGRQLSTDDGPRVVRALWASCRGDAGEVRRLMRESRGGRNMVRLGLGADVDFCAMPDTLDVLPEFEASTRRIVAARG